MYSGKKKESNTKTKHVQVKKTLISFPVTYFEKKS